MPTSADPIRILLVDDDDEYARLVGAQLRASSVAMSMDRVGSLSAAMLALEDGRFDAVLLDLCLPDSDGLSTIDSLAGHRQRPAVDCPHRDGRRSAWRGRRFSAGRRTTW